MASGAGPHFSVERRNESPASAIDFECSVPARQESVKRKFWMAMIGNREFSTAREGGKEFQ
jgi:hypothetical protein